MGFVIGCLTGLGFGLIFTGSIAPGLIIISVAVLVTVIASSKG